MVVPPSGTLAPGTLEKNRSIEQVCKNGLFLAGKFQWQQAKQEFGQALERPDISEHEHWHRVSLAGLGEAQRELGDYRASLISFERFLHLVRGHSRQLPEHQKPDSHEPLAHNGIGCAYFGLGEYKKAIEHYDSCLLIALRLDNTNLVMQAYSGLGKAHYALKDYAKAAENHLRSLPIALKKTLWDQQHAYIDLGDAYYGLGKYRKAAECYTSALSIALRRNDAHGQERAYDGAGGAYNLLGEPEDAVKNYQKALAISLKLGDQSRQARIYGGLGSAYFKLGKCKEACEHRQNALVIALQLDDKAEQSAAYCDLGIFCDHLGEYEKALEWYSKALAIAQALDDKPRQGYVYGSLGCIYGRLGDYKKAVEFHKRDLLIALQHSDTPRQSHAYGNLGSAYESLGEYKKAVEYHEKHLSVALELKDKSELRHAYAGLGNAYSHLGEHKRTAKYHCKHLAIALQLQDTPAQSCAYSGLGSAYTGLGEYKKAIEFHKKHLSIARQRGDKAGQSAAFGSLGDAYYSLCEFRRAISHYEGCLSISLESDDMSGQGRAYSGLGRAYSRVGEHDRAIQYHDKALSIAVQQNDVPGQGDAYGNLGDAYDSMGGFKKAMEYHEKCLAIAQLLDDKIGQRRAYCNLAFAHKGMREYEKSAEYHEKGLWIALELDDKPGQSYAYKNLGDVYDTLGEYDKALEYREKQLSIALELGDKPSQGAAYAGLGSACDNLGAYDKAREYHDKCLNIALQLGDKPGQRRAYDSLGIAHESLKEYAKAAEHHEKALMIAEQLDDRSGQGRACGNLGLAYQGLGENDKALEFFIKECAIAADLDSLPAQSLAYSHLGSIYLSTGKYDTAIEFHEKCLYIASRLGDTPVQVYVHAGLGLARLRTGSYALAFHHFATCVSLLRGLDPQLTKGQMRRHLLGIVERHAPQMDACVVAAAHVGDMGEALRMEEWRRERSEVPFLLSGASAGGDVTSDTMQEMARGAGASFVIVYKKNGAKLFTWVLSGETGKPVYERCFEDARQVTAVPELIECVTFTEWARWQQAFQSMRQAVAEQWKKKRRITRKWLNGLCEKLMPADLKSDLDKGLWKSLHNSTTFFLAAYGDTQAFTKLQSHFFQKAERAMEQLSTIMWEPIIRECEGVKSMLECKALCSRPIYFLPDSILSRIPFAAFKIGGHFLIEKACVAQASSLRTLDFSRSRWHTICKDAQSTFEALTVSYAEAGQGQLYETGCGELSNLLASNTLVGDAASKEAVMERVKSNALSLIHFMARESEVADEEWAGLHLADSTVLSACELYGCFTEKAKCHRSFCVRLVVLCACASARGHSIGEGLQGFARAVLAGGVPCLLAPKWNTSIEESTVLMMRVYAFMASDKYQTVAQALQAAVVSLLHDKDLHYKDSFYYWAALVPHGFASVQLDDELLERVRLSIERITCREKPTAESTSNIEPGMKKLTLVVRRQFEEIAQAEQHTWCEELNIVE